MSPADSLFASPSAPGPHPALAELRAYAAGTLAPTDEHRLEAHALDCERCAELLEGLMMSDAATTDRALAELHTRLQARIGSNLAAPLAPLAVSRPLWPRLAAGVALLGAVGAGFWGWQHQSPAGPAATVARAPAPAPATEVATTAAAPAPVQSLSDTALVPPPLAPLYAAIAVTPVAPPDFDPPHCGMMGASDAALSSAAQPADEAVMVASAPVAATSSADSAAVTEMAKASSAQSDNLARNSTADEPAAAADAPDQALGSTASPSKRAESAVAPTGGAPLGSVVAAKPAFASASKAMASRAATAQSDNLVRVLDKPMPAAPAIAPAPMGGTPALKEYLRREAAGFEPDLNATHLTGSVRLRFRVEADGRVSNLQVVRGLRADYDAEALRMVCEGPAWRPGIANGRRAPLPMELTVSF